MQNKGYFNVILSIINKLNLEILISIPGIFRTTSRLDRKVLTKHKFNLIENDIAIQYPNKVKNSEIFFISHYLGNVRDQNLDFYYHDLFQKLQSENKSFTVILLNKTSEEPKQIVKKFSKSKISRIILNNYTHPFNNPLLVIWITFQFMIFRFKLIFTKLTNTEKQLTKIFTFKKFLQTRNTLLFTKKIKKILKETKIKIFFTTFEGHSFEKNLINYFNKRNIKTFGYFFSVIRKFDSCIFYDFKKKTSPSHILFTGNTVKEIFLKKIKSSFEGTKFDTIGYTRPIKKIKANSKKKSILICPEGFYNETEKMLNFAEKLLNKFDKIEIIFRLHPEIKINNIKFSQYLIKSDRFIFSKNTLEEDLSKSKLLLYRGSSVCINAINNNVIPIYLNLKEYLNIDPLYEINKNIANSTNDIKKFIDIIEQNKKYNFKTFQKYTFSYFQNFEYSKFKKMMFS
jgi:hypothetical protein